MEQRPLRLGDIVDDYCPRERRITNHAIVALVGEDIRQTRCSTCDTEHVFKGGLAPKRTTLRRKDGEVPGQLVAPRAAPDEPSPMPSAPVAASATAQPSARPTAAPSEDRALVAAEESSNGHEDHVDGWLAHRPLIRATLPRTEGDIPTPRPIPEFTMHQRQARGGRAFRQPYGWSGGGNGNQANGGFRNGRQGDGNGNVAGGNGSHDRHGRGGGPGHANGHGRGGPPGAGGGRSGRHRGGSHQNKRSR